MNWTALDTLRRRIVMVGLVAGPALLVLSVAINLTPPGESMRADFDSMAARAGLIVAEALLESVGFMIVLAALAAAGWSLRGRGAALGTWGGVSSIAGIVGFALSNANGVLLAELAQLPDRDAAFATASAIMQGDTAGLVGTLAMAMEIVGQLGMLLVIGGFVRAGLVRVWVLAVVVLGIAVNAAIGTMLATLIADLLLLGVGAWLAVCLARHGAESGLGASASVEPVSESA